MKEKIMKKLPLAFSIVLVLLVVLITVASFMPIASFSTEDYELGELFEGSYTSGLEVSEWEVGGFVLFDILSDAKYFFHVVSVSTKEAEIADCYEYIAENPDSSHESTYERIEKLSDEIYEKMADLSEEDVEKIDELLKDDGFVNALAVFGGLTGYAQSIFDNFSDNFTPVLSLLSFMMLIFLFIVAVACPIAAVIGCITKLICFIVTVKNPDKDTVEKLAPKKLCIVIMGMYLAFYALTRVITGGTMWLGASVTVLIIACVLSYAIRVANKILFEEPEKIKLIAKSGMSIITSILALVVVLVICNMNPLKVVYDNADDFRDTYVLENFEERYDSKYEAEKETYESKSAGEYAKWLSNLTQRVNNELKSEAKAQISLKANLVGGLCVVAVFIAFMMFLNCFERAGMKLNKMKDGSLKPYKPQFVAGILILVLAIAVNFVGVGSVEARDEAYADGSLKLLWDEYKIEDTVAYVKHEALLEARDEAKDAIKDIKEEIKDADDDDEKELLEEVKTELEKALEAIENKLDVVETSHKSAIVVTIILSVVIIAIEFAYTPVPEILEKKLSEKLYKKKDEENADGEAQSEPAAE